MSKFSIGPVTFVAAEPVSARRFVQVVEKGVKHAAAGKAAFGAVEFAAAPADPERKAIVPAHVAVYASPWTAILDVDGDDATIKAGTAIEVGADGKAKAHASGVAVAVAVEPAANGRVSARLLTPVVSK